MRSGNIYFILTLIVVYLIIDLYVYRGLRNGLNIDSNLGKKLLFTSYWGVHLFLFGMLIYTNLNLEKYYAEKNFKPFYTLMGLLIVFYAPKLIMVFFNILNDIQFFITKLVAQFKTPIAEPGESINRSEFLTRMGIIGGGLLFSGMLYGVTKGKYNYRVITQKIKSKEVPPAFNGFKIIHISDLHLGSFFNDYESVEKGFELINELNPDIIVFTGDMVNNFADEAEGWQPFFQGLQAKYGKYSILGNHDYGDYVKFSTPEAKANNLSRLKEIHGEMGFTLLLNSNEEIEINGEKIGIAGVENWGSPPFPQYGDENVALSSLNPETFTVLLSHDPSHWDAKILGKKPVNLTLSGHTHGMQFGVEIPGFIKWSPVQYRYPRWGGLYTENNQHLYVNRGFGFIGFPGRVGMPPEITELVLESEKALA
ncbi:MAG: metallophosphoesterase [Luteibaculaceae bacterium]